MKNFMSEDMKMVFWWIIFKDHQSNGQKTTENNDKETKKFHEGYFLQQTCNTHGMKNKKFLSLQRVFAQFEENFKISKLSFLDTCFWIRVGT